MALTEDQEIARWDELLKDRYTENDPYYLENSRKTRNGPPVIERWCPSGGRGRGRGGWTNERRFDRRRENNDRGGAGGGWLDRRWGGRPDSERPDRRWRDDNVQAGSARRELYDDRRRGEMRDRSRDRINQRPTQRSRKASSSPGREVGTETRFGGNRSDRPQANQALSTVTRNERGWEVEEI
ncbi:hypothetical protein BIW11_13127 [Tropilaelaps mercedesae]|uniref:Uncharacterized protein n=1 Tax=Tropilaelaps mercedesae TaxID=418985 RepID=A0A1V9X3Z3_9ACAR|nr:hypothetical protein BIW11_13127 [Tropilaelaps mercedesae]